MFKSLAVVTVVLGAIVYAQPIHQTNTINGHQIFSADSILRILIRLEAAVEGAKFMYPFSGNVDKLRYPQLQNVWAFFYQHYNSHETQEFLKPYPRVLSLCKAILQRGQPFARNTVEKDRYYESVLDLYRQYRVQKVPVFYNQAMFSKTKVGDMLTRLFGLSDFLIDDRSVNSATEEFLKMIEIGFDTSETFDEIYKYMENKSTYLGTIPATFLWFDMPLLNETFYQVKRDVPEFKKILFNKIQDAQLVVENGQLKHNHEYNPVTGPSVDSKSL